VTPARGEVALFPLQAVLFPGGLLPLRVFEQRYMELAKECLKSDTPFGVCLIREGVEVGAPAMPEEVGCLARIVQWDMQQLGLLQITARGERRFRIMDRRVEPNGLARAQVRLLGEESDAEVPARFAACRRLIELVVEQRGADRIAAPRRFDSSAWLSARLTEILPVPLAAKQKLMELDDSLQRLEILQKFLEQHGLTGRR
jgi:Lon protease-like protein